MKTVESIMDGVDVSAMSEKQKQLWIDYGVIPGPVWNNFNVCAPDEYICTFEVLDSTVRVDSEGKGKTAPLHMVCDLYLAGSEHQTMVIRSDEEWEGSYGAVPLFNGICEFQPYKQAMHILCGLGQFTWSRKD